MDKKIILIIHNVYDAIYLIVGPLVAACGIALFYTPAKLTSGGASGVANILYQLFGLDVGIGSFMINMPLITAGVFVFGFKYSIKTFVGSSLLSMWVTFIGRITGYHGFLNYSDSTNILLSAIFGGVLLGMGIGLTMKSGCNTGGTDVIAQTISHFTPISVGAISFSFNAVIVGSSGYFVGFQPMLFSIIAMFCSSYTCNYILTGVGTRKAKTIYVISDNIDAIGNRIIKEIKRTCTVWDAKGFYTDREHKILMVLVQNHQFQKTLRIINQEDPKAFVTVNETYRALGRGFVPLKKIADATSAED